ncbi:MULTISPECIES: hypothetical protein [unclassified Streptomyces]|uniref:hypothetical protein n=1 Tax=unclassified Streptomyces TaxID=2593676 RepID=UPI00099D9788|nr:MULTISPECIES: hypothetical protein [unclassified Streptomyces]
MSDATPEPVVDDQTDEAAGEASGGASGEPAAAAPLGVARELTGHPGVDARLARLTEVDALPADGHPEVYEDVHRGLRDELTSLDAHPAPPSVRQQELNRTWQEWHAAASTPSWSGASSRARGSTPAS